MAAEISDLRARIDGWRAAGADRVDPVGFHRLDALARRCESADANVQRALRPRLEALAEAHARVLACKASKVERITDEAHPLAVLVAECDARRGIALTPGVGQGGGLVGLADDAATAVSVAADAAPQVLPPAAPPSLQQARKLWKAVRTEHQLRQSLEKPHEDTGPLNSAQLVNRMLLRMGEASPGYLQQLVGYLDVLSELEAWLGPAAIAEPASSVPGRKSATKRVRAKRVPKA